MNRFILTLSCPEKPGIIRAVSDFVFNQGYSVIEAHEYADLENQQFFARWECHRASSDSATLPPSSITQQFSKLAVEFDMSWNIVDADYRPKVLIAVSQHGHCLNDLLYRWKEEEHFPADIVGVVSNHEVFRDKVEWYGLPFFYLPVTASTKNIQEQKVLSIMRDMEVDLLVLARYMQILSDDLCQQLSGRAINIHHSFLPSFKGAKPYHQAKNRGVKISGATAHYVTADLDEGPIIEQDVQRVTHSMSPEKMVRMGRNIENLVLARAVYWHCQQRVILDGNRTIIFD